MADDDREARHAARPQELPIRAWPDIVRRVAAGVKADNVPLLAAGVAFFALLSLFPAIVAVVSIYALVADPDRVAGQIEGLTAALPPQAADLVVEQVVAAARQTSGALGLSAAISLTVALWSASSGMAWLLSALSLAYDEIEDRPFYQRRGTAVLLTLAAAVAFAMTLGLITGAGAAARALELGAGGQRAVSILRWPLLAALIVVGLGVLYRYGPNRDPARWRWVSWGSAIATGVAVIASAAFALYTSLAGSFDEVYGSFGAVIVLMLWLALTVFAILLGAEINAAMELQTEHDTTTGEPQPVGQRGAVVADTVDRPSKAPARSSPPS
jgi:membrane protein